MKKQLFVLLLVFKMQIAFCQNLVINPGFEDFKQEAYVGLNLILNDSNRYYSFEQIDYLVLYKVKSVIQRAKTEKVCSCFFNVEPKSGDAMALMCPTYFFYKRKYHQFPKKLQLNLNDTLKANQTYCIKFYFYLTPQSWFAANDLGIYFYKDKNEKFPKDKNFIISLTPTIKITDDTFSVRGKWICYSINYKAKGGEKYLLFGGFEERQFINEDEMPCLGKLMKAGSHKGEIYRDENSTIYFIDDFTIEPINAPEECNSADR